jgi:hypothetical protein
MAPAEKFQQQNHLVLAVGDAVRLTAVEALDVLAQLEACPAIRLFGFQNARPEELGDILQLIGGKTQQKLPSFATLLAGNHATKRLHQDSFHRRYRHCAYIMSQIIVGQVENLLLADSLPWNRRQPRRGHRKVQVPVTVEVAGYNTRERQSPDWPSPCRQPGDWRPLEKRGVGPDLCPIEA